MAREVTTLQVAGREVQLSSPSKVYFPPHAGAPAITKLELAEYYLAVGEAALRGVCDRPTVLKRWVDGITGESFFQKRVPGNAPEWLSTTTVTFPSGRTATELVCTDLAHLTWANNLGTIDLNPWAVRTSDLDHPDELRIDLDPGPEVGFAEVREVALLVHDLLTECGLVGFPKTSGSRGIHILARLVPEWDFIEVRRAAVALAREIERRAPDGLATAEWWKEQRRGVFIDYNQNARDRTVASAWSVRPVPDARISMPLTWAQVPDVDPAEFTLRTAPALLAAHGDAHAEIDGHAGRLDALLALAQRDEEAGLPDAPWPPNFARQPGEAKRVAPSRARKPTPGE